MNCLRVSLRSLFVAHAVGLFAVVSSAAEVETDQRHSLVDYQVRIVDRGGSYTESSEGLTTAIGMLQLPALGTEAISNHNGKWQISRLREIVPDPSDHSILAELERENKSFKVARAKRRLANELLQFGKGQLRVSSSIAGEAVDDPDVRRLLRNQLEPLSQLWPGGRRSRLVRVGMEFLPSASRTNASLRLRGVLVDDLIFGHVVCDVRRVNIDDVEESYEDLGGGGMIVGFFAAWPKMDRPAAHVPRACEFGWNNSTLEPSGIPTSITFPWPSKQQWLDASSILSAE